MVRASPAAPAPSPPYPAAVPFTGTTVPPVPDPITFTGELLDRAAEHRTDDDWLAAQRADPRARAVVASAAGVQVTDGRLALAPLAHLDPPGEPLLLGSTATDRCSPSTPTARSPRRLAFVRPRPSFPRAMPGSPRTPRRSLNWHRRHPLLRRLRRRTEVAAGRHLRRCQRCGSEHHPRTDPVVIMLVTDGDRVLLGRQPTLAAGPLLGAGRLRRARREPRGGGAPARSAKKPASSRPARYFASQPWPFPNSLMIGFIAPWGAGSTPDRRRLEDLRWFTAAELVSAGRRRGRYGSRPARDRAPADRALAPDLKGIASARRYG